VVGQRLPQVGIRPALRWKTCSIVDIGKSIAPGGCGGWTLAVIPKRPQPRHIGPVDQLDMLDPVAAVARAIGGRAAS
jgi:hypothetical protein